MSKHSHLNEHIKESPLLRHHPTLHGLTVNDELECLLAILMMIFGLGCLLCANEIHELLPILLGGLLSLLGLLYLVHGLRTREYAHTDTGYTAQGIVYLLLGLVLFLNSHNADVLIGGVWGMLGLFKGTEKLNEVFAALYNKEHFVLKAFHAALDLFLGVTVLLDPISNLHHHILILGLELMVLGIQILLTAYARDQQHDEPLQL